MKKGMDQRKNRILGKKMWYGFIMAAMLMLSFPVQAKETEQIGAEVFMEEAEDMREPARQIDQIEDSTQLDAEFSELEEESVMIVEEVERQRAEARRSKMWGAAIIILVVGIFSMGLIATMQDKKAQETDTAEGTVVRKKGRRQPRFRKSR